MGLIYVLCFLSAIITASIAHTQISVSNTCPSEVLALVDHKFLKSYNGFCFQFVLDQNQHKTYPDASQDCSKDGGKLVMPKTQYVNNFLTDQLINEYNISGEIWIGLHREKQHQKFVWDDGSDIAWSNFGGGIDPSNRWYVMGMEDCVVLDTKSEGTWLNLKCEGGVLSWIARSNNSKAYICQYEFWDSPSHSLVSLTQQYPSPVSIAHTQISINNTCPEEVLTTVDHKYLKVYGGFCLLFVLDQKQHKIYPDAKEDCTNYGGDLAMPKTQYVNNFLTDQLINEYNISGEIWIGLHREKQHKQFVWDDGSDIAWSNFGGGIDPSNRWYVMGMEDCVVLDTKSGGTWLNLKCEGDVLSWIARSNNSKAYICQYAARSLSNNLVASSSQQDQPPDPAKAIDHTCPSGLVTSGKYHYLQVWEGSCLRFVIDNPMIYEDANKDCKAEGGTLAMPKTQTLNAFIADMLLNHYHRLGKAWIGLNDLKKEGHFVWEDGTKLGWSNFAAGQGLGNNWLTRGVEDC